MCTVLPLVPSSLPSLRATVLLGILACLLWAAPAEAGPSEVARGPGTARASTGGDRALRAAGAPPLQRAGSDTPEGPHTNRQSAPDTDGGALPRLREQDSWRDWGLTVLVGTLLAILVALVAVGPFVILAVSLVMEEGCLRYGVFAAGWIFSTFSGMIVTGLVLGLVVGGLDLGSGVFESLGPVGVFAFVLGYPVAAWWGRRWLRALPRERRLAWKQSLTGGALLGFGAGSVAGLLRSAASGFGGFGGGSFGGGGASGSWSGSAASGTAAPASGTAAAASGASTGAASASAPMSAAGASGAAEGGWARFKAWGRRFQWYHGVGFVLAVLAFAALGAWTMAALRGDTGFLVLVLGSGAVYGGYRLWRRLASSDLREDAQETGTTFQGGKASESWS